MCHVLTVQDHDNGISPPHIQLLSQKLIDSNMARHQVLVSETTCPVYLGELFDSVQEGVSTTQEELQPSQFVLFQSSHCS